MNFMMNFLLKCFVTITFTQRVYNYMEMIQQSLVLVCDFFLSFLSGGCIFVVVVVLGGGRLQAVFVFCLIFVSDYKL